MTLCKPEIHLTGLLTSLPCGNTTMVQTNQHLYRNTGSYRHGLGWTKNSETNVPLTTNNSTSKKFVLIILCQKQSIFSSKRQEKNSTEGFL